MRFCTKCNYEKLESEFYVRGRGGFSAYCKTCTNMLNRLYKRENRERMKVLHKASFTRLKERVWAALGRECVNCGFSDIRALQVDHIAGGGRKERLTMKNRAKFLRHVLNNLPKYQTLCANCNVIKGAVSGA